MITDSKILAKTLIRTHTRRTPTGGVTTVREHEDIRQRKQEKPTKTQKVVATGNTPEKVGKYLIDKKVPISVNNGDKKQSGIAISKAPNGKNIVIQYADWENKGNQNTAMNTVRTHLNAVGLDISEYKGTGKYYIHKKGIDFFGHGEMQEDKNKKKETDDQRTKKRKTTTGIMDMLDKTHKRQTQEKEKTKSKPKSAVLIPDKLIKDAKNYKTAGEFIKAQPKYYHGTNREFEKFDKDAKAKIKASDSGGIYFTPHKDIASNFGKNIKEAYLNINNPKIAKNYKEIGLLTKKDVEKAKSEGFDGYYFKPTKEEIKSGRYGYYNEEMVAFSTDQIKTEKQLKDIWNKAHDKKAKKSKTNGITFLYAEQKRIDGKWRNMKTPFNKIVINKSGIHYETIDEKNPEGRKAILLPKFIKLNKGA